MIFEDALNIYTDGSSLQHPQRGGMGIRYVVVDSNGHEALQDEVPLVEELEVNRGADDGLCID